jgi:hypothetical protein
MNFWQAILIQSIVLPEAVYQDQQLKCRANCPAFLCLTPVFRGFFTLTGLVCETI